MKLTVALVSHWNFYAKLSEGLGWLERVTDEANALWQEAGQGSEKRSGLLSIKAKAIYEYAALSDYLTIHALRQNLFEEASRIYPELGDDWN